jgi:hypothetical protein
MNDDDSVQWEVDGTRKGWKGKWDNFIGPGATRSENILIITVSIIAAIFQVFYALIFQLGWDWFQTIIAMLLAADIAGGAVANFTNVLKRWYHREGQTFLNHFRFILTHIYPIIVGLIYRNWDLLYGIFLYGFLLLSAVLVLKCPLYLRRPVALALFFGSFILTFYIYSPIPGLEWFYVVLFLKLINGNIIKEEPYRPKGR